MSVARQLAVVPLGVMIVLASACAQTSSATLPGNAQIEAASTLERAQRALRRGDAVEALAIAEAHLKVAPDSAQSAFVRAVALAELNETDRALAAFVDLTQRYPHLAEPYNNLAVLHAARGQYGRARDALEQAISANPQNATAYQNLGDVHAALALQAYEKATGLAPRDRALRTKLALARQLREPRAAATPVPNGDTTESPTPSTGERK